MPSCPYQHHQVFVKKIINKNLIYFITLCNIYKYSLIKFEEQTVAVVNKVKFVSISYSSSHVNTLGL